MKKLLTVAIIVLLYSCKKEINVKEAVKLPTVQLCKSEVDNSNVRIIIRPLPKPNPAKPYIIFIRDGYNYSGGMWGDAYTYPKSGISSSDWNIIISQVVKDYKDFKFEVTDDINTYNQSTDGNRSICVTTSGVASKIGYVGGDSKQGVPTEPCFIEADLLGYVNEYISLAISHEIGHTLGLHHQSIVQDCTLISEYQIPIDINGVTTCPIMGNGYGATKRVWQNGYTPLYSTSLSCYEKEDEPNILSSKTTVKKPILIFPPIIRGR